MGNLHPPNLKEQMKWKSEKLTQAEIIRVFPYPTLLFS